MAASNLPLRIPERQPETGSPGRMNWPRPAKKPSAGFRNLLTLEPNHRSAMPCSLTPTRSGSELCV